MQNEKEIFMGMMEFGHGHDAIIKEMMDLEKQKLNEVFPVSMEETDLEKECKIAGDDSCSLSEDHNESFNNALHLLKTMTPTPR